MLHVEEEAVKSTDRDKPKRADFRYKNKRYWVKNYHAVDSSAEGEIDHWYQYTFLDYDTDEEVDEDIFYEEDFMDKGYKAAERIFPPSELDFPPYGWC